MFSPSHLKILPDSISNKPSPKPLSHEERVELAHKAWLSCQGMQSQENKQDLSTKGLPLKDFVVHVDMITNGTNISEASYGYLIKLGAKVEKRMNKKCNLVIWKDGNPKTIDKAKEYGAHVVNSLWLEDCIENDYCAPFDKYYPILPKDSDWPFAISSRHNKGKKRTFEAFGSKSFDLNIENHNAKKFDNGTKKKLKTNFDDNTTLKSYSGHSLDRSNSYTYEKRTFGTSLDNIFKANTDDISCMTPFYFQRLQNDLAFTKKSDEDLACLDQDQDQDQENGNDNSKRVKNLIRKYTQSNFDSISNQIQKELAPIQEDAEEIRYTPEKKDKEQEQVGFSKSKSKISPLSYDTISMSEEFVYDLQQQNANVLSSSINTDSQDKDQACKIELNKIFAKYLQPKILEPSNTARELKDKKNEVIGYNEESKKLTPQKTSNWNESIFRKDINDSAESSESKTRCSTIEKSPLISKYLSGIQKESAMFRDTANPISSFTAVTTEFKSSSTRRENVEKPKTKTVFGRRKEVKEVKESNMMDSQKYYEDDIEDADAPPKVIYNPKEKGYPSYICEKYATDKLKWKEPESLWTDKPSETRFQSQVINKWLSNKYDSKDNGLTQKW